LVAKSGVPPPSRRDRIGTNLPAMNKFYQSLGCTKVSGGRSQNLKFHAALADRAHTPEYGLWAYVRSLDIRGSGWAVVNLEEVSAVLDCGKSTFYRWLRRGGRFFRHWRNLGNQHFCIYYRSVYNVYVNLDLTEVGPISVVDARSLRRNARKIVATELTIACHQKQAYYAAIKSTAKALQRKIIDPQSAFRSDLSQSSRGTTTDRRFLKLDADAPICPHGSLIRVSQSMNRSISTIQRRTADRWRKQNGFDRLEKLRVIRKLNAAQIQNFEFNQSRERLIGLPDNPCMKSAKFLINPKSSSFQYVAQIQADLYFLGGNVYRSELELKGFRKERKRIRRALSVG